MHASQAAFPDLHELARLFYNRIEDLGTFENVSGDELPKVYSHLLNHNYHMTVTVETHHGCPVDVRVLEYAMQGDTYRRKILLTRQSDDRIVMFGIVRLHMNYLTEQVRAEVKSQKTPLGRVLINHNVLRRVELGKLWKVTPGDDVCRHFQLNTPEVTFGRTAMIHCDEEPAIELVEIVTPETFI